MNQEELDVLLEIVHKLGIRISHCPLDDLHIGEGQGMGWLKKVPMEKRHSVQGTLHVLAEVLLWAGLDGFELKVGAPPTKFSGSTWHSTVRGQDNE